MRHMGESKYGSVKKSTESKMKKLTAALAVLALGLSASNVAFAETNAVGTDGSTDKTGIVFGAGSTVDGDKSIAIGNGSKATMDGADVEDAVAIGTGSVANGDRSIAIGKGSKTQSYRIAPPNPGPQPKTAVEDAIAIGTDATVASTNGIAIGKLSAAGGKYDSPSGVAKNGYSIGIGYNSKGQGGGIAIGSNNTTYENLGIALAVVIKRPLRVSF